MVLSVSEAFDCTLTAHQWYPTLDGTCVFTEAYRWNVDIDNGDRLPCLDTSAFGTLVLGATPVVEVLKELAVPQTFDAGVFAAVVSVTG